jgi:SET domain-containing protein
MKIVVRPSLLHGLGVFAATSIREGEFIARFTARRAHRDGTHVLWMVDEDGEAGYEGIGRLRYLNHSSTPNGDFFDLDLHATRTIRRGEEITINYDGVD